MLRHTQQIKELHGVNVPCLGKLQQQRDAWAYPVIVCQHGMHMLQHIEEAGL
jgi:hypothetical protein